MKQTWSWGIVGGGMLGLTLAHRLSAAGQRVTIFEAADRVGGLASAWELDGVTWDRHYHVTLLSDSVLRSLLGELGLEEEMRWKETKTGFYTDGQFYSMSNTLEFLQFPPLGLIDKLRLGGTIFYASRIRDWKRLEKIPVADWLKRCSGRRTFERIWRPLLRAKLGETYRKTSAAFIWATIARMYAARRSGMKKEMFGYVPGGYARILKRFGGSLIDRGVEIRLSSQVKEVVGQDSQVVVRAGDEESRAFDRVVVTAPAPVASRICPQLDADERKRLEEIQYLGIVCPSLLLNRPLSNYYVTNITDDWVPFTAVIEMSALVDPAELDGHSLVYLPRYVLPDDPLFEASDQEIRELFLGALKKMHPDLHEDHVRSFRISRVRHVFALSTLNYSDRLPPIQTSVPGLSIVNSSHIVNGTLNVNETIQLVNRTASLLIESEGG